MTTTKVRADYDQLAQIARLFAQQAETTGQVFASLRQQMEVLQAGKWVGQGADTFYREMSSGVFPPLNRLTAALKEAASTTQKVSQIMRQAEDEAAGLFRPEGAGVPINARGSPGTLAFFDWEDVVNQDGERYTPPPHGPTPPANPGGKVVKIEHGNRLTPEQLKEWRKQHPTAPIRRIDKTSARHPKFSEAQLTKDGYYKARTDFDDDQGIKTETWLKDKKQDLVNGKGEAVRVQRSWEGNSIFRRVPPGPGFYKDYDDFSLNWISHHGFKYRSDNFGNKPGVPVTVEQFWENGYYYATSQEIYVDPTNGKPRYVREYWVNDRDGTMIQVDQPLTKPTP